MKLKEKKQQKNQVDRLQLRNIQHYKQQSQKLQILLTQRLPSSLRNNQQDQYDQQYNKNQIFSPLSKKNSRLISPLINRKLQTKTTLNTTNTTFNKTNQNNLSRSTISPNKSRISTTNVNKTNELLLKPRNKPVITPHQLAQQQKIKLWKIKQLQQKSRHFHYSILNHLQSKNHQNNASKSPRNQSPKNQSPKNQSSRQLSKSSISRSSISKSKQKKKSINETDLQKNYRFKTRQVRNLNQLSLQQIFEMIDRHKPINYIQIQQYNQNQNQDQPQSPNKIKIKQKYSQQQQSQFKPCHKLTITNQFMLANYIQLCIQKMSLKFNKQSFNRKKQQLSNPFQNQKISKQQKINSQLKLLNQHLIQIWNLYQSKIKFCPEIFKANPKNQEVIKEVKEILRSTISLQYQLKKSNKNKISSNYKINTDIKQINKEKIMKKLKYFIQQFRRIILLKTN